MVDVDVVKNHEIQMLEVCKILPPPSGTVFCKREGHGTG
jgi:hypothetical protein